MKPPHPPKLHPSLIQDSGLPTSALLSRLRDLLPGVVGIGVVIGLRLLGAFQGLELAALDAGLRWRSPEPMDDRVVIIGINEADIQAVGTYPIPDGVIAKLLTRLQTYDAQVIGLDIVRDLPVEPGHADLVGAFESMDNIIGAETVVPDRIGNLISPPAALTPEQVGFFDALLDQDGHQRRALLGSSTVDGGYQFAIAVRLAAHYLQALGLDWGNGQHDPRAMRFGMAELPRIFPSSGGYVGVGAGGNQTLINFRRGPKPFPIFSLTAVLNGEVDPESIRDRVVLIGITATSAKSGGDVAQSSAVNTTNPGLIFGVEIHAHVTSQIISAALEGRSLLHTWADGWEYSWIILWGLVGIGLGRLLPHLSRYLSVMAALTIGLVGVGYGGLLLGWWLPVIPVLLIFLLNGIVLHGFYLYNQLVQERLRDRQRVIDQTFAAIHNGPLQTLAHLMRQMDDDSDDGSKQTEIVYGQQTSSRQLRQELAQLNDDLRGIYAGMRQAVVQGEQLHLQGQAFLDLRSPLHELLYEVYTDTLQRRSFPHFQSIKVKVVTFEPFEEDGLSLELKRALCRFLEEALCNVGKHATGVKRLTIDCHYDGVVNRIRVVDNGVGLEPSGVSQPIIPQGATKAIAKISSVVLLPRRSSGQGTQQAQYLARRLGGQFQRSPHHPRGTCCELVWLPQTSVWQQIKQRVMSHLVS